MKQDILKKIWRKFMENIQFDSGMQCFRVNEKGVLRFNPADPNVYVRFQQALESLQQLEQDMAAEVTNGADFLHFIHLFPTVLDII